MYRVLTCLTTEHDWRLVVLAGTICWLASAVAISAINAATIRRTGPVAIILFLPAANRGSYAMTVPVKSRR